jgi:hypothetical protein
MLFFESPIGKWLWSSKPVLVYDPLMAPLMESFSVIAPLCLGSVVGSSPGALTGELGCNSKSQYDGRCKADKGNCFEIGVT